MESSIFIDMICLSIQIFQHLGQDIWTYNSKYISFIEPFCLIISVLLYQITLQKWPCGSNKYLKFVASIAKWWWHTAHNLMVIGSMSALKRKENCHWLLWVKPLGQNFHCFGQNFGLFFTFSASIGMILLIPFYHKKLEQCCMEKRSRGKIRSNNVINRTNIIITA